MEEATGYNMTPISTQPGKHAPESPEPADVVGSDLSVTPVTTQPGKHRGTVVNWMERPVTPGGCPEGLEYLTQIDQLICKQKVSLVEVFTGFERNNKFGVFNSMGQQVYFAMEESSCAQRQFCGNGRGFKYHITDNNNKEVLTFVRPFKCCAGCSWCADAACCILEMEVLTCDEETLGFVRIGKFCCKPRLLALNRDKQLIGEFHGPCCVCKSKCCGDINFPLFAPDMQTIIGKVAKQWSGGAKEFFTDADNFSVTFPLDMDVRCKAVIFAATFMVDMIWFESNN